MLIGLDPLLGPDLLHGLRAMGHGDEIAIVDGNYPALEHARRLVRLDGHPMTPVLAAILSVLPLDWPQQASVFIPAIPSGHPLAGSELQVHADIRRLVAARAPEAPVEALDPETFYPRVKAAHLVVATSEPRLFGNVILRKGVIDPA